ncbi:MAG: hypothetical protein EPN48_06710 [Microbacteriaceae bacterium]|nr:MAG: hypothetical protein EPN48_06710 [Microbacteriaceae bacterium]
MTTPDNITPLIRRLSTTDPDGSSWIDLASDPASVQELGRAIANVLQDANLDAVLGWWAPDEAVLAHTIAAALQVPRSSAELDLGLISVSPRLPAASRVLVVATTFDTRTPRDPLAAILEGDGHTLVATVELRANDGARITRLP